MVLWHIVQRNGYGAAAALGCYIRGLIIHAEVIGLEFNYAGGVAYDKHIAALGEVTRFHLDLRYANAAKPIGDFPYVNLVAGGLGAINGTPFTHLGTKIVSVPEASVEYGCKAVFV